MKTVDGLLEISIGGSFSRLGYAIRRRVEGWTDPARLEGKTMIVTGASSGIGQAAAVQLAALGAEVWLVGRNSERLRSALRQAEATGGPGPIHAAEVDLVNAEEVLAFVERCRRRAASYMASSTMLAPSSLTLDFQMTAEELLRSERWRRMCSRRSASVGSWRRSCSGRSDPSSRP